MGLGFLLGGSWVVLSRVLSIWYLRILITRFRVLVTLLATTHEPASKVQGLEFRFFLRA